MTRAVLPPAQQTGARRFTLVPRALREGDDASCEAVSTIDECESGADRDSTGWHIDCIDLRTMQVTLP
jgi:hypothetical protein